MNYKNTRKDKIIKTMFMLFIFVFFFLVSISITGLFIFDEDINYKCKDCNVIFISIDTLRADHLGYYGYYRNTTPNIDRLAEESIVFKNAFSQAPYSTASHMTMITSLYPTVHQIINDENSLNKDIKTLAEVLKENGYSTSGFINLIGAHGQS